MGGEAYDVLILGAGIAGCCTALELARRGVRVGLLDQDAVAMNRASLRNEGKIHLGLIYANDQTFETARLQLTGALRFRALLERWIGDAAAFELSTPFVYAVARDSVLSPEELEAHYDRVSDECAAQLAGDPALSYLGLRPDRLAWRLAESDYAAHFDTGRVAAAFQTEELSINTDELAVALRCAVAESDLIDFLPSHRVRAIARTESGLHAEGDSPGGTWMLDAEQIVNATWENRCALDASLGLEPPPGLLHRLKYRVMARVPRSLRSLPSVTMVLGRYGDVVLRPRGDAYFSWYPAGLQGWTNDVAPPETWDPACRGEPAPAEADEITARILSEIARWYPAMTAAVATHTDAGAIVALGKSDVDDRGSQLHDRTHVGVTSTDGFHSLDPGKLTTGPLFAMQAADAVTGRSPAALRAT